MPLGRSTTPPNIAGGRTGIPSRRPKRQKRIAPPPFSGWVEEIVDSITLTESFLDDQATGFSDNLTLTSSFTTEGVEDTLTDTLYMADAFTIAGSNSLADGRYRR